MANSVPSRASVPQGVLLDVRRPRMAKASVKEVDGQWLQAIGRAITAAISLVGWTKDEAAGKVDVHPSEFNRWCSGERRAQFDRLFAVEALRWPLVRSLAGLADAEVVEEIRKRERTA